MKVVRDCEIVNRPCGCPTEGGKIEPARGRTRRGHWNFATLNLQPRRLHGPTRRDFAPALLEGLLRALAQGVHPCLGGEVHQAVVGGVGAEGVKLA